MVSRPGGFQRVLVRLVRSGGGCLVGELGSLQSGPVSCLSGRSRLAVSVKDRSDCHNVGVIGVCDGLIVRRLRGRHRSQVRRVGRSYGVVVGRARRVDRGDIVWVGEQIQRVGVGLVRVGRGVGGRGLGDRLVVGLLRMG